MNTASVYALTDPRDGVIRYVGYSKNPVHRYRGHIKEAKNFTGEHRTHKICWIQLLLRKGLEPQLVILQVDVSDPATAEMQWIYKLRRRGCNLTNSTDGGDGIRNLCKRSCKRLSYTTKRNWSNSKFRKKVIEGMRKADCDPEHRAKISERALHIGADPKERARRSERAKKRWSDPKFKARVSRTLKKVKQDPAFRAKMSENAKRRWANPEFKARVAATIRKTMLEKAINDPTYKQQCAQHSKWMKKKMADPKVRAHLSQCTKKQMTDPVHRQMISVKTREGMMRKCSS